MQEMTRLLAEGRIKEALAAATRHLAQHPQDEEALLVSAKVALVERRAEQAEQLLSRVKSPQTRQEATLMRAAAALQREDWNAARAHYESLTRAPQPPAEAWHGLGVTLLAQGTHAAARDAHERAVALKPKQPGFRFELGRTLLLLKQERAAVHQFVQSLRLEPKDPRGYWILGYVLHRRGKTRSARRVLEAGIREAPESQLLRDVVGPKPASPGAPPPAKADKNASLIQQAQSLLEQKRAREARKLIKEATDKGERSAALKIVEAEACKGLLPPDTAGAIAAYEEAIRLEPGNWVPHNDLALFLLEEGLRHRPRVFGLLAEARRLAPRQPEPALNLVVAQARYQRIPEALALIEEVLAGMRPEHRLHAQATALRERLKKA